MSLVKGGKDVVNAKKLYNWILSPKALGIFAKWFVVPVSEDAPQDAIAIDVRKLKTVEQRLVWEATNKERLLERWNAEIGAN